MSAGKKALGMYVTATYSFSFASIAHENMLASSDTVVDMVSSLLTYSS